MNAISNVSVSAPVVVADSITSVADHSARPVIVCGSHGGVIAARFATKHHPRGVILNDAGVGMANAGIAGLDVLDSIGLPGATVGHETARIGDGADMLARGVISYSNARALSLGIQSGLACAQAAELMAAAQPPDAVEIPPGEEATRCVLEGPVEIWLVDSASLVIPSHAGHIVITGSHGGLVGGKAENAIKAAVRYAVFNDAGIGVDRAGIGRLAALEAQGIAAAAVAAGSARIGDAQSTWETGVISVRNAIAARYGVVEGLTAGESAALVRAGTLGNGGS